MCSGQSCTSEIVGQKFDDAQLMVRKESASTTVFCVTAKGPAGLRESLMEERAKVEACAFLTSDDCTYHRVLKAVRSSNAEKFHVAIILEHNESVQVEWRVKRRVARAVKVCMSQLRAGGQVSVIFLARSRWWERPPLRKLPTHNKMTMIEDKCAGGQWIRWLVSDEWLERLVLCDGKPPSNALGALEDELFSRANFSRIFLLRLGVAFSVRCRAHESDCERRLIMRACGMRPKSLRRRCAEKSRTRAR